MTYSWLNHNSNKLYSHYLFLEIEKRFSCQKYCFLNKRGPHLSIAPAGKGHSWRTSQRYFIVSHKLVTAKLNVYRFGFNSYLLHKKQRTKINHSYCLLFGVLQGSILGSILFNIFLCDLFLIIKDADFASYADDNTIYKVSNNIDDVLHITTVIRKALQMVFR